MSDYDFGGTFANVTGALQQQDQRAALFPVQLEAARTQLDQSKTLFPLTLQHTQASTRMLDAEAGLMETRAQAQKQMAQIMQGQDLSDPTVPMSTNIMKMAGAAIKAGDTTTGNNLMMRGAQALAYETAQAQHTAQQSRAEAAQKLQLATFYGQLMAGVRNSQEYDAANLLFQAQTGEAPPSLPYSPENVRILQQGSMKMADRIRAEHFSRMESLRATANRNTKSYHDSMLEFRRQQEQRRAGQKGADTKNAGKDVGAPTKGETDAALNLLDSEGKTTGLDGPTKKRAGFDLAARARALRRQNPGLDMGEAMQRAYTAQVSEGYFSTRQTDGFFGLGIGSKTQNVYGRPGASVATPVPLPSERSQLKPGTHYRTPKGVLLYNGPNNWTVPKSATAPAGADDGEDDDEE